MPSTITVVVQALVAARLIEPGQATLGELLEVGYAGGDFIRALGWQKWTGWPL